MENNNRGSDKKWSDGIPKHYDPKSISAVSFAKARARELKTIHTDMGVARPVTPVMTLQKHMRRRAMSHDIKRFPCRLRRTAEYRMQKIMADAKKKTIDKLHSRRHRRRPKNLREEFAKRQQDKAWLETHLWHAKRFKMTLLWGYRLPLHPSDKSLRAAYRSTVRHCTIQDVSFYGVVEVKGCEMEILDGLNRLTSTETGLRFGAKMYTPGQHHGDVMLYHQDRYPYGAITKVQFVWKPPAAAEPPSDGGDGSSKLMEERQLWIWVHPSAFMEALSAIRSAVNSVSIQVNDLRGELTRLRLRGPQATAVITDGLKAASMPVPKEDETHSYWWQQKIYKNPKLQNIHREHDQFWEKVTNVQSCTELPSRCVLGFTVRDPRVLLPIQRTKVETDPTQRDYSSHSRCPFPTLSQTASHIWEEDIRRDLAASMLPTHEINELRRNLLIPGSPLDLGSRESRVPVLLLQSPGVQRSTRQDGPSVGSSPLGFGSGWDVVLPKKWSPFFWMGFVYRGARAVGLKEEGNTYLHQGVPRVPEDHPDTRAGREFDETQEGDLQDAFMRRVPAKRVNHAKLGFLSPFRCPWRMLLSEWMTRVKVDVSVDDISATSSQEREDGELYVLRSKTHLRQLQVSVGISSKQERRGIRNGSKAQNGRRSKNDNPDDLKSSLEGLRSLDQRALVWVRVELLQKGTPEAFSMICLPKEADIEALRGKRPNPEPQETLKKQFRLDRNPKKKQKKLAAASGDTKGSKAKVTRLTFKERVAGAKLLELNSRTIIGFVTSGGYVLSRGKGHAVGFCCLPGLLELAEISSSYVLVRGTKSTQYRFASITVMT